MKTPEFTTVIQGKIHRHSLDGILNYKKFGDVVVSTWYDSKTPHLTHPGLKEGLFLMAPSVAPHSLKSIYNPKNLYLQILTTLRGLYQVKTPYAIKVRSDESFSNLVPFHNMVKSTEKIVSSNIYFRPDNVYKFHMSDHIIGCKTEEMIAAFELAKYRCENHKYFLDRNITYYDESAPEEDKKRILSSAPAKVSDKRLPPEVLLCTSFLMNRGLKISSSDSVKLMMDNFTICRTEWMGKCRYKTGKYRRPDSPLPQINYMSQLVTRK